MPIVVVDESNPFYEQVLSMCKSVRFRDKELLVDSYEYLLMKYPPREKETNNDKRLRTRNESNLNY